eukprot:m51a1_g5217 hypothetical protein (771) ;mRNA; f:260068-262507
MMKRGIGQHRLRLRMGLGGLCVALIAGSVVVSVVPQWVVWYVQSIASTREVSRDLIREVANKVLVALEMSISQAEQVVVELALIAAASAASCSDDHNVSGSAVIGRWRDAFSKVSVDGRTGWAIISADRFGSTLCIFGTPPEMQWKVLPDESLYINQVVVDQVNGTIELAMANPGRLTWGRFFVGVPAGRQLIAASMTHGSIREPNKTCGIRGVLMSVTAWQRFLRRQKVGKTGNVWLIEADTMLLFATTRNASLFVGSTAERVQASSSTDPMTHDVGEYVKRATSGGRQLTDSFDVATIGGRRCQVLTSLVRIHPETGFAPMYHVIAIPTEDYWGAINRGVVVTVVITAALFALSLAVGIIAALVFVSRPLQRASKTIARLSCLNMVDLAAVSGHQIPAVETQPTFKPDDPGVQPPLHGGKHESIAKFGGHHMLAEVRDLLQSARKMAESLYAVGRYVSMDLCTWIIENRVVEMPLAPRIVTTLFCDIEGSTAMIDRSKREGTMCEFGRMLNEILTTLANVAKTHGGYIDKLMGDEVMALFNAPYECPHHQAQACSAALAMHEAVADLSREWDRLGLYLKFRRPRVRIGVAAGEVLVGDIGAFGTLTNFTAIGETVCIASRLQSAAKALDPEGTGILLTGETWAAASAQDGGGDLVARTVGCVKLRGPDQPVLLSTIVGRRDGVAKSELAAMQAFDRAMEAFRRREWAECVAEMGSVESSGSLRAEAQAVVRVAQNNLLSPDWASNVTHDLSIDSAAHSQPMALPAAQL